MGLFKKKSHLPPGDAVTGRDNILGYFDVMMTLRTPLSMVIKKKTYPSAVYTIHDRKNMIRIQHPGIDPPERDWISFGFSMDNTWFVFQSILASNKGNIFMLAPDIIHHRERRKYPRCSFTSRENVNVSVLQDLGKGIGVTGPILNISPGGFLMNIQRAMSLEAEKQVPLRPDLYKKGTRLFLIKIKNLAGLGGRELKGTVVGIRRSGSHYHLAVAFLQPPERVLEILQTLVDSRVLPFKPVTRSRRRLLEQRRQRKKEAESKIKDNPAREENRESEKNKQSNPSESSPTASSSLQADEKSAPPQKILILGRNLAGQLRFRDERQTLVVNDIAGLVEHMTQNQPDYICSLPELNHVSVLDLLSKILQKKREPSPGIILFLNEHTTREEMETARKASAGLKINQIIKLPLTDDQPLEDIIRR